ncbi:MAG: CPXCG motif-containing cysteine-rich protein [Oceanospirillaceae bacterium]|nr:CPXCG motif-containing cysteine-rich protein [Oceanospirillaceae bacterium]
MNHLNEKSIGCPYCGETIEVLIDSTDLDQQYIEDCQVCCKPIIFVVSADEKSELVVNVHSEDEAF